MEAVPKRVLLTGASGFVGRALGTALAARGDSVIAVARNVEASRRSMPFAREVFGWNALAGARDIDAIVHLAGESIAQRWTPAARARILGSRVGSAQQLLAALPAFQGRRPQVFVGASAVGFYGDRGDEWVDERSSAGTGFLAETCMAWEKSSEAFQAKVERLAVLRIGLVLGAEGGALEKMLPAFRMGAGGRLGSGKQWMSWIQLEDLVALFLRALDEPKMKGIYNAVAPEPVRNRDFAGALAGAVGSKARLPVPAFALRLALGEMSALLLEGQRVAATRLAAEGFRFRYPGLLEALRASVGQPSPRRA